jgi:hypothetical protein
MLADPNRAGGMILLPSSSVGFLTKLCQPRDPALEREL